MLTIRRPLGRLIFNMWIAIPGKTIFLIETASCTWKNCDSLSLGTNIGCQPDEPLASLVTTNRIINVCGFLVITMLPMYAVPHCLYSVGNWITTTTNRWDIWIKIPGLYFNKSALKTFDLWQHTEIQMKLADKRMHLKMLSADVGHFVQSWMSYRLIYKIRFF